MRKGRRKFTSFSLTGESSSKNIADLLAVKLISKEIFHDRVKSGKERADSIVREVIAQAIVCLHAKQRLRFLSPSSTKDIIIPIVEIFGIFETIDGFAIELELMDSKDLYEMLVKKSSPLDASVLSVREDDIRIIIFQIVLAVSTCMKVGVVHRDIKPSNIVVSSSSFSSNHRVKLADFGMAGFLNEREKQVRGRCGSSISIIFICIFNE